MFFKHSIFPPGANFPNFWFTELRVSYGEALNLCHIPSWKLTTWRLVDIQDGSPNSWRIMENQTGWSLATRTWCVVRCQCWCNWKIGELPSWFQDGHGVLVKIFVMNGDHLSNTNCWLWSLFLLCFCLKFTLVAFFGVSVTDMYSI